MADSTAISQGSVPPSLNENAHTLNENGAQIMGCSLPWRAILKQAVGLWLASRVALATLTYFVAVFSTGGPHHAGIITTGYTSISPHTLLSIWQRWDANWVIDIAQHGYSSPQSLTFFPLYPFLIRMLTFPFGGAHALIAAMFVSNVSALAACIGLGILAAHDDSAETGSSAIRALIAYPLAFLLAAPLPDSLFLALALCTLVCARRGYWQIAAFCAFAAMLTSLDGIILLAPLAWEAYQQQQVQHKVRDAWHNSVVVRAIAVLAVPLALGTYLVYATLRFDNPQAVFGSTGSSFGDYGSSPAWALFHTSAQYFLSAPNWTYSQTLLLVDIGALTACALLTIMMARRMPFIYTLYMIGLLVLCLFFPALSAANAYRSAGRLLVMAAPLFLVLGRWSKRRPWLDFAIVCGGCILQAICLIIWWMGFSGG